jgi:phosphate transport system substrate-binding protein
MNQLFRSNHLFRSLFRSAMATCVACFLFAGSRALAQDVTLTGSGATFPYPFYAKLFSEYNKAHPGIKINYSSVGSGTGIKQISDKSTDFGASDAPMTDAQLKDAKGGDLLHIPMTLGAVVPIYNVPGVNKPLVFSGPVLADIFRGKITAWNDPAIAGLNPGVKLPDAGITVVHRSDGSGTTYVFADYLSKVSPDFAKAPGKGTTLNWPVEDKIGAKGNEGVSGVVQKTPGTIGYVELIYAMSNKISFGDLQNKAGKVVHASLEGVTAAAFSMTNPPADLRMSITDAGGDAAYPISAFTYLLVYKDQTDATKGRALVDFLKWATTDGQKYAPDLHYAPLPENIVKADQAKIDGVVVK